ncbi:MFS transporter [Bacillus massiliigorillae]|uniref:MFS transporter n=1 Tax=Bacillus massiliigorillae TaxID=1243664 RepID=UPI00039A31CF|nr:MFS transporter [Bacillus massiliigorillae]
MGEQKGLKIVFLMCVGIFLCMIDTTIMNIALPAIQLDLSASFESMSWVLNVYTMTIAIFSIPLGRVAELFGKAKMYIVGLFIFGIGSTLCAIATSVDFLILSRFIQSIGAAILFPTSMVIGISSVPLNKRNIALAILGVTQGLSAALGPAVGGIITEKLSWEWVFLVNVPICIVGILFCFKLLNVKNEVRVKAKIDWSGLVLISLSIFLLTEALVKVGTWGWGDYKTLSCLAGSGLCLLCFIWVERKVVNPMVNLQLFKDRTFVGASFAVVLSNLFLVGVTVLLPTFLTRVYEKTEIQAAIMVTPISGMIFLISPLASLLLDKLGKTTVILTGFIMMAGSYYWLEFITVHTHTWEIILPCMLLGTGFGLIVGPITVLAASSFEGELLTASQSVVSVLRQIGIVLAIAIFVSALSNNLVERKQEVIHFAERKVDHLHMDALQKEKVLERTIAEINRKSLAEGADTYKDTSSNQFVSEKEKQQIISQEVSKALSVLPIEAREQNKAIIEKEVSNKVEQKIIKTNKEVQKYVKEVTKYSENHMSKAFTDLYKTSTPIIFICSLISFIFYQRKRSTQKALNLSS